MIDKIITLILLTFVPIFELRWSIPIGLFSGNIDVPIMGTMQGFALPLEIVFITCILANIVLGGIAYLFFDKIIHVFLKIKILDKLYKKIIIRSQRKTKPLIDKYGFFGLALFIAIPLPGSGTWTGAVVSNLMGIGYKKFFLANMLGVTIAGIIVTAISIGFFSFI
ncbi:MAG TPA: small multi-drug export protein [archaeon]|nr:small multi-drug export protein [archaeon]